MKTIDQIKAENLEKMKAVTAKRKMMKTIDFDDVEVEVEIEADDSGYYKIDPAWDSTEGLDIKKLVA